MPALYKLRTEAGKVTEMVRLVDCEDPDSNDFAIVEEATLTCSRQPVLAIPIARFFRLR